jgi:thioredoxin-related protein
VIIKKNIKMIKKTVFVLGILIVLITVQSFTISTNPTPGETDGPVHWYTFGQAVELQKKNPRMIIVDVYTSWCGPCKMMSAYTFGHPVIANYINEHFYPVKFNAETRDSVIFNGNLFINTSPPEMQRPVHEFAKSILDNKLMYPSIVFLNEELIRAQTLTGYFKADQFEPIVKFFGSGRYKDTKYEDFMKTFVPEIKPQ